MRILLSLIIAITLTSLIAFNVHAQNPFFFTSLQLGADPDNGECLTTNGVGNVWGSCGSGGGGGGDSVSVDGSAVVDPNFVSTGDIDFVNTSNTITANINAGAVIEPDLNTDVAAVDGDFLQYDSTGTNFTWRSASEVKTDLSLGNVENTALSTWAGSTAMTTLGTIATGVWQATALTDTYVSDTITVGASGSVSDSALSANVSKLGTTIGPTELDISDFGDFTCNGTTCALDATYLTSGSIGVSVQAYDADLTTYAGITPTANTQTFLGAANYAAMRTQLSLGSLALLSAVGTSDITDDTISWPDINYTATLASDPAFLASECWFATTGIICEGSTANTFETLLTFTNAAADRTITFQDITGTVYVTGGTDVAVADGGTGASTLTAGGILQGNGTGAVTATAVLTNGQLLIGDGTTFPTVATLTAGTGVSVTNGAGSITLASSLTAGRSLTVTGADFAADAELFTDSKTLWFENPTASDDFKTIWVAPVNSTITSISCESDQTVTFDLQVDDGTPTGVNGSDITCTTFATDSVLAGDATMATGERLDLAITSVSGTPTWVSITFAYTKDD
jgi:hypothetical protein